MGQSGVRGLLAAAAIALATAASPVAAGVTYYFPLTTFEDDNRDRWVDANSNGVLDTGDQLIAALEMRETSGVFGGGPSGFGTDELTGIANITVLSSTFNNVANTWSFVFGPTVGFMGNTAQDVANGLGAMVALWLDPNPDLNLVGCASTAACETAASNGNLYAVGGFAGDTDEFWVALDVTTNNPASLLGVPASSKVGVFNYAMSFLVNNTGVLFGDQDCPQCLGDQRVEIIGSGDLLGGQGLTNGYVARSDFDFQVAPLRVPEPGSLALLAVGLLGASVTFRTRKR